MSKRFIQTSNLTKRQPSASLVKALLTVLVLMVIHGGLLATWANDQSINWSNLDLNTQQESEIGRLESQWQRTYTDVYPQIQRDKNELRQLLNAPQSNDRQIMELQTRIQQNEQRLRQEATRTFLNKKGQLSPAQRVRLQQMMGH